MSAKAQIQTKAVNLMIRMTYRNSSDAEIREIVEFLQKHPEEPSQTISPPPYEWVRGVKAEKIVVERDAAAKLPFVRIKGTAVYFPRDYSEDRIRHDVFHALVEQYPGAPHCYQPEDASVMHGDTAVLAGASDGYVASMLAPRFRRVILFEASDRWREPLQYTLAPYKDKVEVNFNYIGDGTESVKLDSLLSEGEELNFFQADIEGAEPKALLGAKRVLSESKRLFAAVCVYHNRGLDTKGIQDQLQAAGMRTEFSPGYVVGFRQPFLRKCLIFGRKGLAKH